MLYQRHPRIVLREAWNNVRLNVLRTLVQDAIVQISELDSAEAIGGEPSTSEGPLDRGAVSEALATCCDELREECGIPTQRAASERERLAQLALSKDWVERYSSALDKYHHAAGALLERRLRELEGNA